MHAWQSGSGQDRPRGRAPLHAAPATFPTFLAALPSLAAVSWREPLGNMWMQHTLQTNVNRTSAFTCHSNASTSTLVLPTSA